MSAGNTYSFRDTEAAAERLRLVSELFEPELIEFLQRAGPRHPELALDLGCGPGHTTRLLTRELEPQRAVGIDSSTRFLELARRDAPPDVSFIEHDVTTSPFPTGPADLLFCRLLLSHLPDPAATLRLWATQLLPGGLILADEVETIDTDEPVLRRYLDILVSLIEHNGGRLYAGRDLVRFEPGPQLEMSSSEVTTLDVSADDAARMFRMSLGTWRVDPFIEANYSDQIIDALVSDLEDLVARERHGVVVWRMRQTAFRKTG